MNSNLFFLESRLELQEFSIGGTFHAGSHGFCAGAALRSLEIWAILSACDRGEHHKCASSCPEQQTHKPKPAFPCKRGNCSDGNGDLEHGHTAGEHFVLVKT